MATGLLEMDFSLVVVDRLLALDQEAPSWHTLLWERWFRLLYLAWVK